MFNIAFVPGCNTMTDNVCVQDVWRVTTVCPETIYKYTHTK